MPITALDSFNDGTRVALWVFGRLDELSRLGLVREGSYTITVKGRALYDQLVASGYRPKRSEVERLLRGAELAEPGQVRDLATLVLNEALPREDADAE